jgi:uncharacterized phiE125 gp8 family phage protein
VTYALGQPVPITVTVRDSDGLPADATTVTLTVTKPDGTTDPFTGGALTHPSTGVYQVDYAATLAGLHTVRWVATGVNASAPRLDSFYVEAIAAPPLVSLADARTHLGLSQTTNDDQLAGYLQTASRLAEDYTGKAWRRTAITKTYDGRSRSTLRLRAPVISVTSVVEDGATLTSSYYALDAARGLLYRSGYGWSGLTPQNVVVSYVAGPTDGAVPESIRHGVLEMVRHLWETQRGRAGMPARGGDSEWSPDQGFSVPRRVQELWDHERAPLAY